VWRRVIEMLDLVGIPNAATRVRSYPHELSGGMQQRVIIACALILRPKLVIADEPTTALDVTVQAQILDLLRQLQESERNTAIILITHDLGVVAQLCQRICVMYAGRIVEMGSTTEILQSPKHPYTIGLIGSIPRLGADQGELQPIPGTVPDLVDPPSGCRFHPRCSQAMARCAQERPPLLPEAGGTRVACHLFEGLA
jgi:peptide/nickel transport system ATP-binding protein/oligopeptide transport system ATP-binding protein